MLTYTHRQSEGLLFKKRTAVVQKAECFHAVLSNSNLSALKSYRLNNKCSAYFQDDVFNKFDYNLILLINNKSNPLKMKPIIKKGWKF